MNLNWIKCGSPNQTWCDFINLNLDHPNLNGVEGVYMIWHGAPNPAVVRLGQGNIRDRLKAHRLDPEIIKFWSQGLYATWASVPATSRDGVEKYLANTWSPKVGDAFPNVAPIAVNSPW